MNFSKVQLSKLKISWNIPVTYSFNELILNTLLGRNIIISWTGNIFCVNCNKNIKKTFGDGFCYPCFIKVPQAAPCIINPELCRAHLGEGRDIEWERKYHLQEHIVYLSYTDDVKVGITRKNNRYNRWMEQGAVQAVVIATTPNRYIAGLIEVELKNYFKDKTSWHKMLCCSLSNESVLDEGRKKVRELLSDELQKYFNMNESIIQIKYPQIFFPDKVTGIRLEKTPNFEKELVGFKGQYLIFSDSSVINFRNHTGFEVNIDL